jgi:thiamine-phosphate pyrophosphorylase
VSALPRLHLITDDDVLADPAFPAAAEAVLDRCAGAAALHVRGPATSGAALHRIATALQAAALRTGALLLVNDRVDVAMAVRANGVQLGARSMSVTDARGLLGAGALIGRSVHSTDEALDAETDGADFVIVGTIFESASHPGRSAAGTVLVRDTTARAALPAIAIGGITPERVPDVAAAGAAGVAVLGSVWRAADPVAAAAHYVEIIRTHWAPVHSQEAG